MLAKSQNNFHTIEENVRIFMEEIRLPNGRLLNVRLYSLTIQYPKIGNTRIKETKIKVRTCLLDYRTSEKYMPKMRKNDRKNCRRKFRWKGSYCR